MKTLRGLAQAVVDASGRGTVGPADYAAKRAFCAAANCAYDDAGQVAGWLLAALDAERAQGYARAMTNVAEWCKAEACDEWRTWPRGPEYKSALADVARWAASAAQQPPQPLDRVQEPASHADGQDGRDEG